MVREELCRVGLLLFVEYKARAVWSFKLVELV